MYIKSTIVRVVLVSDKCTCAHGAMGSPIKI
jgi:hypothetical protein